MEIVMRIKFIGAAAAVAIMASGLTMAQTQPPAPSTAQPSTAQPSTEAPSAATTPPSLIPPGPTPAESQTGASEEGKMKVAHHTVSACQQAIKVSEKALAKSQASADTIAQAWQHIENAKQEKGQACKDEAKQAREML